jgi:hypothetical protein
LLARGEVSTNEETRKPGTMRLKQSFGQLKRAIASFI